jgi:site-specific DNA recombinase
MTEDIRTETPMDKVMITMAAAMNQYERENIKMRMNAGALERAKKGLWHGSNALPYGYRYDRNDGMLYIVEDEAEKVREIFRLYNDGLSCNKIAIMLFGDYKKAPSIHRTLKKVIYIGLMTYNGENYQGVHEPIIDEETFYKTQELMKRRQMNSSAFNNYQLSGLCYCGLCGARMRYKGWSKGKTKIVCYSTGSASHPGMRRTTNCPNMVYSTIIESEVESQIKEFAVSVKDKAVDKVDNVGIIQKSIDKANNKIKKFYDLYVDNPTDNLLELIKTEEDKVKNLKRQLSEEKANASENESNQKTLKEIERVADVWDTLTDAEKSKIYKKCIDKITITPNGESWDIEVRWSL